METLERQERMREIIKTHMEFDLNALISEMEELDSSKFISEEIGSMAMGWHQSVKDKLQNKIDSLRRELAFSDNNLSVRQELNTKVIESLNEVKGLIQRPNLSATSIDSLMRELAFEKPKRYTYDELNDYTSNFKKKVGSGAFGDVYFGKLSNGLEIAVKVLKMNDVVESMFEAEVRTMGKTYHRHLVKLYGFCLEGNYKALVYEYLKNGSLDLVLYKKSSGVEWSIFYRIAVEMAKALAYLHDGCTDQIIHHDVKAANVLLDAHFSPRITDFGLANLMNREESHQTIISGKGTRGYAAPEVWSPFSHVTFKCDVYSFGMVLFEVLGRRVNGEGDNWVPRKVWNMFVDDKLDNHIVGCGIRVKDRRKAKILALVAFWCAQYTPETRPTMSTVVTVLAKEILVNVPPNPFLPSDPKKFQMQPAANDSEAEISFSRVDVQQKLKGIKEQHLKTLLETYEKILPPGGEYSAILYTSSMGGLRKFMSDCEDVRLILESHDVKVIERDLWINPEFTKELKDVLKRIEIPALFVRGRFIGGAEQVMKIEEAGKLKLLFYGLSA